jgi:hypothetical protein
MNDCLSKIASQVSGSQIMALDFMTLSGSLVGIPLIQNHAVHLAALGTFAP